MTHPLLLGALASVRVPLAPLLVGPLPQGVASVPHITVAGVKRQGLALCLSEGVSGPPHLLLLPTVGLSGGIAGLEKKLGLKSSNMCSRSAFLPRWH